MGYDVVKGKVRPIRDHVLVTDLQEEGIQLKSGIYIPSQDGKTSGIKPRWAKVYAIGPEQKDVSIGEWIYVSHGRWTRGIKIEEDGKELTLRRIDSDDILIKSDELPEDILIQNA
jgi:co-chaperonin GroES (HSP10)